MKRAVWSWTMGLASATMVLSGCASDDLKVPEAELVTPGAFVAVQGYDADHEYTLVRTIERLNFEFETLLFFSTYDVDPTSWDDARELAKKHDLPLRQEIEAQPMGAITERPWQVVWFRTLTAEEEGRVK